MAKSQTMPLAAGMRVICRDSEWIVRKVDPSDYTNKHFAVQCLGVDDMVRGHEAIFLTQLDKITPVDPKQTTLFGDTSRGFQRSKLYLEAQLRQMPATGVEPDLEGLGAFDPMAFQTQVVDWALKQLRPRLLLSDAVGLGKTIQVGMVLTELMRRGRANRLLVLAKKSMLTQFQSELWNRFNIPLIRLDSDGIRRLRLRIPANKNPFEVYPRVIISIDTLKDIGTYRHFLEKTRWDCVVIDEAHNVAGASVPQRNLSHRLARLLSRRTDSMLLTTATPHNGKRETFGRLISLLDPSAIPDPDMKEYDADDIRGFFFMRFKEDVRDDVGENMTDRIVTPLSETTIPATDKEEQVYEVLSDLRDAAKKAKQNKDKAWNFHPLMQYGLYKSFLSSPEACLSTVVGRKKRISEKDPENPELDFLSQLEDVLSKIKIAESSRFQLLVKRLKKMGWNGKTKSPRVLIFTESRKTQDALVEALAKEFKLKFSDKAEDQSQQSLAMIHGSQPDIHIMKAVEEFGTGSSKMRMLVATDVASEGINLHHECHNIIHYDLPWSIITLIQRNGRIDRFGQTEDCVLQYLMVKTRNGLLEGDEAIFEKLINKVEEINRMRQQGESVLQLYDAEAEEQYIADHGILDGNEDVLDTSAKTGSDEESQLESVIADASIPVDPDYLAVLLGQQSPELLVKESKPSEQAFTQRVSRPRLFTDREFLQQGYSYLAEHSDGKYQPIDDRDAVMVLTAPEELRQRLGSPNEKSDVVFGSTAIPSESWPKHDQFHLTDDPERVALSIKHARSTSGYWAQELLCSEQHPILGWINERLLMLMQRSEAPIITSKSIPKGDIHFVFIGQVSSLSGSPLVVDAHSICFKKGGQTDELPILDAMKVIGFDSLMNDDSDMNVHVALSMIPGAVDASIERMQRLKKEREESLEEILLHEERRLSKWKMKRKDILYQRIEQYGEKHPKARQAQNQLDDIAAYLDDRASNWRDTHFTAAKEPSTKLVLVCEGV